MRLVSRGTAGALLLAVAVVVFVFSVVRLDPRSSVQSGFAPWPDGAESLDAAVNLARHGSLSIQIAGQPQPSRYPFGYSLLGALAMGLGAPVETALYRVNQTAALFVLLSLFVHLRRKRSPLEAGLSILVLAASPAFIILSRGPRSEISSLAVLVAAWIFLSKGRESESKAAQAVGAFLLGVSLWFRISNLLLLPFALTAVATGKEQGVLNLARNAGRLFAFSLLGVTPLLIYHGFVFGHPLRTGYSYWLSAHTALNSFQLQYAPKQLSYLWRELTQQETLFRTSNIYGYGSYLNPSLVVLIILGLAVARRDRLWWWSAAAAAFYFGAIVCYFYVDFRLYLPVFALALVASLVSVADFAGRNWKKDRWRAVLSGLVILAAIVGLPGKMGWSSLNELLDLSPLEKTPEAYSLVVQARRSLPPDALVLTDMNPPYVHALGGSDWVVAPLTSRHQYRFSPANFVFDESSRDRMVIQGLSSGEPLAAIVEEASDSPAEICPLPGDWAWKVVYRDPRGGSVAIASR